MRFAGTRMEGFLSDDRPDYGEMAQKGLALRNKEETAATDLMGKTAATGIAEAGRVEAANITGAAQAAVANAQGNAAIMKGIGGIASSAIGAIPTGGGSAMPGVDGIDSTTDYSWNAPASQYEPGSISSPGWSWQDL